MKKYLLHFNDDADDESVFFLSSVEECFVTLIKHCAVFKDKPLKEALLSIDVSTNWRIIDLEKEEIVFRDIEVENLDEYFHQEIINNPISEAKPKQEEDKMNYPLEHSSIMPENYKKDKMNYILYVNFLAPEDGDSVTSHSSIVECLDNLIEFFHLNYQEEGLSKQQAILELSSEQPWVILDIKNIGFVASDSVSQDGNLEDFLDKIYYY